jgi:hypothetical protein
LEFIRKLFGSKPKEDPAETMRGAAPVQSQEEQDATRTRMEAEMADQRDAREAKRPQD